jgi:putative membrane protein
MKHTLAVVCCLIIVSLAAMAAKKGASNAPMTDQQFVDFAAQTDMVEANLGQLASTAGDSQGVKDYGQMLATDHTADYKQLGDVAKQASLNVPSAIDDEHNKLIAPMYKLKGTSFDKKFAAEMVAGHTKAIEIYKKEAADAQNSALKSYAQETLTALQKHLDGAKDLGKAKPAAK